MTNLILPKHDETEVELRCSCGHWSELSLVSAQVDCGAAILQGPIPCLTCNNCGLRRLPKETVTMLRETDSRAWKEGRRIVKVNINQDPRVNERYSYCANIYFQYTSIDYLYIPGLANGSYGFYTPVFFRRDALKHFDQKTAAAVSFVTDSYGFITTESNEKLAFGINANGNLLIWLGELDSLLTTREQMMLLSYNVPSDHCVGSDFYAQRLQ